MKENKIVQLSDIEHVLKRSRNLHSDQLQKQRLKHFYLIEKLRYLNIKNLNIFLRY
jgi:hypothetical protein